MTNDARVNTYPPPPHTNIHLYKDNLPSPSDIWHGYNTRKMTDKDNSRDTKTWFNRNIKTTIAIHVKRMTSVHINVLKKKLTISTNWEQDRIQ